MDSVGAEGREIELDTLQLNKIHIEPNEIIIIKFPFSEYSIDVGQNILDMFRTAFPNNLCMLIPLECDIQVYHSKDTKGGWEDYTYHNELDSFLEQFVVTRQE